MVGQVAKCFQSESYSAIREIGLVAGSALVFTTKREPGWTTPEGDIWTVYSISMKTAKLRQLLSGYDMHMVMWLNFVPRDGGDLGITHLSCSEREPSGFGFTFLRAIPNPASRQVTNSPPQLWMELRSVCHLRTRRRRQRNEWWCGLPSRS